ncbi:MULTISPECIES: hypothetical protein [Tissierellales]|jgi:hypothetical protein|uniref:Uncharacterized protein n=1 Tax=Acidilutibacter cellobiosedens TaxID=2507161 RepID=A0A410Q9Y9_9FIRM|nr:MULTISPECIES: hypothetical protein [Tissierellales]QAT60811.1 hypothetical protein EQM13_04055 [Acidilutibacter cellobiosedens]SCL87771.1 hypothetical protein PP176A_1384 [Sporanaerobacter sp. PP17-6a]
MEREYKFDKKLFLVRIVYASVLTIIVLFIGIYKLFTGTNIKYLWMFICFLCIYTIITNFVSISYPGEIIIGGDKIIFKAFKRSHVYSMGEITSFKIKEQRLAGKLYIRINSPSLFRGRYWIDLRAYDDYKDLETELLKIEEMKHPDSLKQKIKVNNSLYSLRRKEDKKCIKKRKMK